MDDKLISARLQGADGGVVQLQGTFELVNRLIAPYLTENGYVVKSVDTVDK